MSLQPTYFPAVANLAQLDLQEKKPEAAKKRFETILEKDKKNIQAMTALANLALSQGKTKEATAWLERSATENPDALQPACLLTAHYLRLGEKQKSLTLAKKLQGVHPHDPEFWTCWRGPSLRITTRQPLWKVTTGLRQCSRNRPLLNFGIASIQLANQNAAAASDALKKALAIKPDYLDAQLAQVALESRQGNYEKAMAISHQIQKQQKKSPVGYIAEGDLLMAQKNQRLRQKRMSMHLISARAARQC